MFILIFLGLFIWLIVAIKGNTDVHRYPWKSKDEIWRTKNLEKKKKKNKQKEADVFYRKKLNDDYKKISKGLGASQKLNTETNWAFIVTSFVFVIFVFFLIWMFREGSIEMPPAISKLFAQLNGKLHHLFQ